MRIAIDTTSQKIGGGVSVARNLAAALASERPSSHLTLFCASPALADAKYPENVEVRSLPRLRSLPARIRWQQLALPRLLREGDFDLLLALGGFTVFRTQTPQLAVWQNPNIFTRIRIPWRRRTRLYIWLQRWAQQASMSKATLNVFLTRESVREASTRWDMDRIPHVVIHNGIELPEPSNRRDSDPFVLAVGHSYFHKNYETLIDAMARLREIHPERIELRIAGGAVKEKYHGSLEERIRRRGLEETVRFLGPLPAEEVAALYERARVYVLTSLLESFGLTPLEAMSHGAPVLASNASCIPEVCGDAALFCDPLDVEDVARKLRRLLTESPLREQLRSAGWRRAAEFSWESRAREYWDAIDRCLAPRPAPEPLRESA